MVDVALLDRVSSEVKAQKEDIGLPADAQIERRPESYRAWDSAGHPD